MLWIAIWIAKSACSLSLLKDDEEVELEEVELSPSITCGTNAQKACDMKILRFAGNKTDSSSGKL